MKVIPRPASTVLLMDHKSNVYLTKRPKTMKVLAGYYVFPGGSVEHEDAYIDKSLIKNWKREEDVHLSHYVAAVRELFEEVGVFLGLKSDGSHVEFSKKTALEYRRLLIHHDISFSEILNEENLYLDLQHLKYFGHRVTPKGLPVRFDTRFFIAKLPIGQTPNPECEEIEKAMWMHPKEALTAYIKGKIQMAGPTLDSLKTIMNHKGDRKLMLPFQEQHELINSTSPDTSTT